MKSRVSRWQKRHRGTGLPRCQFQGLPLQSTKYRFLLLEQAVEGERREDPASFALCKVAQLELPYETIF